MDILTIIEAANMLGMTKQGVYQAIKRGRLAHVTILGKKGLPIQQVRDFAAKQAQQKAKRKRQ